PGRPELRTRRLPRPHQHGSHDRQRTRAGKVRIPLLAGRRPACPHRGQVPGVRRCTRRAGPGRSFPRIETGAPAMAESPTHIAVAIVGGGQAGLSLSYYLKERGIDHLVFEKTTVMHVWKEKRWDSFCLVTPNWQCDLPGHPYHGPDPDGFMTRD